MPAPMSYYCYKNGWLHGPAEVAHLVEMLSHGDLPPDAPFCSPNGGAWLSAEYLTQIARQPNDDTAPPPMPYAGERLPPVHLLLVLRRAYDQGTLTREQCERCNGELVGAPPEIEHLADYLRRRGFITAGQADDWSRRLRFDNNLKVIGGYEILEELGTGKITTTFKARQTQLDRIVALKVLSSRYANDQHFIKRFASEARLAAKLEHPNIASLYAVGVDGSVRYIAMEYVDGLTLAQAIKARGALPEAEAIDYVRQICAALDYAYGHGIVHRDISSKNIMITRAGHSKLIDLGLAKERTTQISSDTGTGVEGTPAYISPERALDRNNIDIRSDIYSLGCVFYEMLCGHPPFVGESALDTIAMHLRQTVPEVKAPNVSMGARAVIRKMTWRELSARYQSAADLLRDLNDIQHVSARAPFNLASEAPPMEQQLANCREMNRIELALPGDGREYLRVIGEEIDRRLEAEDAPPDFQGFVQSTFAELTENAFAHGVEDGKGMVYVRMEFNPHFFRLEVEDSGEGFDAKNVLRQLRVAAGTMRAPSDSRGLMRVQQVADLLEYNKKGNKVKAVIYRRHDAKEMSAEKRDAVLHIEVAGKGSVATNEQFRRYVDNYRETGNVCVSVLVNWVSSVFVGSLLALAEKVEASGGKLAVFVEQPSCLLVMEQLGVTAFVKVEPTLVAAMEAVGGEAINN